MIRLEIDKRKDEGDQSGIRNLQKLKDLQSKLMLVAGKAEKGKKEVDRFVEVSVLVLHEIRLSTEIL